MQRRSTRSPGPITIKLCPPTEAGRLYPKYEKQVDILVAQSKVVQSYPYGVNIDSKRGTLILDIAENHVLAGFELIAGQRSWTNKKIISKPQTRKSAAVEFSEAALSQKEFALALDVTTNDNRSRAEIWFGRTSPSTRAIALSDLCIAFVDGDRLLGFHVDLMQYRWW